MDEIHALQIEATRLREQVETLLEEKEQLKNDVLFHRKKADEYLRQLNEDKDSGGRTLQDWLS
jgi:predicted  nucleic acid-binding Zn-ribbon protein